MTPSNSKPAKTTDATPRICADMTYQVKPGDSYELAVNFSHRPMADRERNKKAGILVCKCLKADGTPVKPILGGFTNSTKYGPHVYLGDDAKIGEHEVTFDIPKDTAQLIVRVHPFTSTTFVCDGISLMRKIK